MNESTPAPPPRRPVGRPRVVESHASVATWLPASTHDRLIRLAKLREQSVSATVRELLILRLP